MRLIAAMALVALVAGLPACTSTVRVHPISAQSTYQWVQRALPASDGPSAGTLQLLRLHGLADGWREHPMAALRRVTTLPEQSASVRFAAVELSLLAARRSPIAHPSDRLNLYLAAAARAWSYLFDRRPGDPEPGFDQNYAAAVMIYAEAVARVTEAVASGKSAHPTGTTLAVAGPAGTFAVTIAPGDWQLGEFAELAAVDRLAFTGLPERFVRYGLGAPFAGLLARDSARHGAAFFPPKGLGVTVTAVLRFAEPAPGDNVARRADLELEDPRTRPRLAIAGEEIPIAADFTAPYAYLASRGEREIRMLGHRGMFSPGTTGSFHRLVFMEPYDPHKTPLVLVHGLWSDPSTWLPLTNRIAGDARLRDAYQVWYFLYPSGEPFPWTAAMLRDALDAVRHELDPHGTAPAMRAMVLVGHSMGGLLVKSCVTDSGDALWRTVFTVPPAGLRVPAAERARLRHALVFTPRPYVRDVIFLNTPQHGCRLARSLIGRLASALIALPQSFSASLRAIARAQPDAATAPMRARLRHGGADAVEVLRPDNPVMQAFAALPIAPGVRFHTILGDRGEDGGENASDGVVTYRSGHLAGAYSETLVPCDHHDTACPAAIDAIVSILRADVTPHRE